MTPELPLFPLHTVLFPGTPLHLHIFEERYKRLINTCIQENQTFGVVLIRRGAEALGPLAEPHYIGCSARIIHVQRLEQGRMNVVALGQERFRILSVDRESNPYLVGTVVTYSLINETPQALIQAGRRLRPWVERFIQVLLETGGAQFDLPHLPDDPLMLAYMAAAILQIPPSQKQELLTRERAEDLVRDLLTIYRRESALLDVLLSKRGEEEGIPFSRN